MSNYSELLKDPRWQKKRLEILKRDKFTCKMCRDNKTSLHIHHEKYTMEFPWDEPKENLKTVCEHCHVICEELKKIGGFPIKLRKIKYGNDPFYIIDVLFKDINLFYFISFTNNTINSNFCISKSFINSASFKLAFRYISK